MINVLCVIKKDLQFGRTYVPHLVITPMITGLQITMDVMNTIQLMQKQNWIQNLHV